MPEMESAEGAAETGLSPRDDMPADWSSPGCQCHYAFVSAENEEALFSSRKAKLSNYGEGQAACMTVNLIRCSTSSRMSYSTSVSTSSVTAMAKRISSSGLRPPPAVSRH